MANPICKECSYSAVCLPTGAPVAFEMAFNKAIGKIGLKRYVSKFELMTMRGGAGYLERVARAYHMAADKVPCERPRVRMEVKQDADLYEVSVLFSTRRRVGYCNVQELHTFSNLFGSGL